MQIPIRSSRIAKIVRKAKPKPKELLRARTDKDRKERKGWCVMTVNGMRNMVTKSASEFRIICSTFWGLVCVMTQGLVVFAGVRLLTTCYVRGKGIWERELRWEIP